MDKELPESEQRITPPKAFVRLTRSQLNDSKPFFRGTVPQRRTLSVEDLADRMVEHRTSYRRETIIEIYRVMTQEIYDAIEDGFNVDIGLCRTELVVSGRFDSANDRFDPRRHTLQTRFRPSPRLNQACRRIPAETRPDWIGSGPAVNEISVRNTPYRKDDSAGLPFNTLPAGYDLPLFLHGLRLKLMGDAPEVGLTLRCLDTGETCFIAPNRVFINTSTLLGFQCPLALTPGEWEVVVATQYNHSYRPYLQPRYDYHDLTVLDTTAP